MRAIASILLIVFVCASATLAEDPATLLETVREVYGASRMETREGIECEFTYILNDAKSFARYRRQGEKYYQASIGIGPDGEPRSPNEVAFDGQRVYNRARYKYLLRSTGLERGKPSFSAPEQQACGYADIALGFSSGGTGYAFELVDGKSTDFNGRDIIELRFRDRFSQSVLTTRHAADVAFWPIAFTVESAKGGLLVEATGIEYAKQNVDGNTLFYPVSGQARDGDGNDRLLRGNTTTWMVEQSTLKLGHAMPPEQFTLAPWPCDIVFDWEGQRTADPQDPTWSPVGKVGFPWDRVVGQWEREAKEGDEQSKKIKAGQTLSTAPISLSRILLGAGIVLCAVAVVWRTVQARQSRTGTAGRVA